MTPWPGSKPRHLPLLAGFCCVQLTKPLPVEPFFKKLLFLFARRTLFLECPVFVVGVSSFSWYGRPSHKPYSRSHSGSPSSLICQSAQKPLNVGPGCCPVCRRSCLFQTNTPLLLRGLKAASLSSLRGLALITLNPLDTQSSNRPSLT